MQIKIKLDLNPLGNAVLFLGTDVREFAMRDALNRAMDGMYTTAKTGIAATANIAVGDIAKTMTKFPAAGGGLSAEVRVVSTWFSASYARFGARRDGAGASFQPWKDKREMIAGGFVATMKSGHESIFKRTGKGRLPIADVGWGPNPARELAREDHGHRLPTEVSLAAQARFSARFAYQYERSVSKAKSKFGL